MTELTADIEAPMLWSHPSGKPVWRYSYRMQRWWCRSLNINAKRLLLSI